MHITLRPNEKIYINGAVLRVDRKVSIELMNDAVFLLEAHVMTERNATTPLRKLYFIVQLMLIEPQDLEPKKMMFNLQGLTVANSYANDAIQTGLATINDLVTRGRQFEALKVIRSLFATEDALIEAARPAPAADRKADVPVSFDSAGAAVVSLPPVRVLASRAVAAARPVHQALSAAR